MVLLIEDNRGDARLLHEMLKERQVQTIELRHVVSLTEAEAYLAEHCVDAVLLDLGLPESEGLGALRRARAFAPRMPLVVLTGLDDEKIAIEALQEGAQDYLIKGQIEAQGLLRAIRYAIKRTLIENALIEEKEQAEITINCISDAVACVDVVGNITLLNLAAERMTGWPRDAAIGLPMADVLRVVSRNMPGGTMSAIKLTVAQTHTTHFPPGCTLLNRDGSETAIEGSASPSRRSEGKSIGSVVAFRDVTEARKMASSMAYAAEHDFLTGLPNRKLLIDRVEQAVIFARGQGTSVALLYLDLDGFKHVNDSLGHSVGDKLLQSVSRRLDQCVRTVDTVSREGGDEFIVLLYDIAEPEDAAIVARRILCALAAAHPIEHQDLHITASIGISVYPGDGGDAETLIKNADTAMYQAKENAPDSYQFFAPAMADRAMKRQSIEQNLRGALDRQEFTLHYQPKINLSTGLVSGTEALIRWIHPTRGLISPADFVPIAEDCGLIVPIGKWVMREACAQARAWADAGLAMGTMAVNVSSIEFSRPGFLNDVFAILMETRLNHRMLEVELTESVLMKQADAAALTLEALQAKGVRVAIDDFGTGYSSLSYLQKFRIDTLKIDQSFVRQITTGGGGTHIVNAVIAMAQNLDLRVVAEGVETQEELAVLRARGCDEGQGYYFSRPLPPDQVVALLKGGHLRALFSPPRPQAAVSSNASRPIAGHADQPEPQRRPAQHYVVKSERSLRSQCSTHLDDS
jgi:diguanylate cyclase (GGDEF)-like protein/PAS domain S-box-containing protein